MFDPIKSILFATNLSPACRTAFEAAIALSARYQATLVLMHVIEEEIPLYVENEIRAAMGEDAWYDALKESQNYSSQMLIGKMSSKNLAHTALRHYCHEAQINKGNCDIFEYDTVVTKGDIIASILDEINKRGCDVVVMGARNGFLKNNSLGPVIKGVMRNTKIPVLFVPPKT